MVVGGLMRVLLCKIHCPFICFCKPGGPLKLDSTPLEPLPLSVSVSEDAVAAAGTATACTSTCVSAAINGEKEEDTINGCIDNHQIPANAGGLRSSLRISNSSPSSDSQPQSQKMKKVQWLDSLGKELAQIREFESSEPEETEYEGITSRGCICSIL